MMTRPRKKYTAKIVSAGDKVVSTEIESFAKIQSPFFSFCMLSKHPVKHDAQGVLFCSFDTKAG